MPWALRLRLRVAGRWERLKKVDKQDLVDTEGRKQRDAQFGNVLAKDSQK
jgi:hypothetical protein